MIFIKRLFDISGSLFGLIILAPLIILIIIIIKIKMPGPVFFLQYRVGYKGKLFRIIKFRTMITNHNGNSVSIKGESRITGIGSHLRKYKLDELPELINVFIGDMSFVGPRPDISGYADKLKGEDKIILSVRPGITSPASIKYRNEEMLLASFDDPKKYNDEILYPDKIRINKSYIENWTFAMDIKIILYTIIGRRLKEPWLN